MVGIVYATGRDGVKTHYVMPLGWYLPRVCTTTHSNLQTRPGLMSGCVSDFASATLSSSAGSNARFSMDEVHVFTVHPINRFYAANNDDSPAISRPKVN